jgi:hypothetical protein
MIMRRINFGRVEPSFLIIGTQKGGTTSLHEYLIQHPKLIAPVKKELHFFDTKNTITNYLNNFPKEYFTNSISFESTPRYMYYPDAGKKIFNFNPKMKFIVLLRNPVKRAFSAWNMYSQMKSDFHLQKFFKDSERNNHLEKIHSLLYENDFPSFKQWVDIETGKDFDEELIEPSIIRRGYYKEQIDYYLKYFPKKQFLFIETESLKNETLTILNSVSDFLGIKPFNNLALDLKRRHERSYAGSLSPEMYEFLSNHFQQKNRGLEELVDLKLSWM